MIQSMTGYGHAIAEFDNVSYSVDIRTVNNRYVKLNVRLPEIVSFAEDAIEKQLKKTITRGMVNYSLRVKSLSADEMINIDPVILEGYINQIKKACSETGLEQDLNITELINLPGVLQPVEPDEEKADQIKEQIQQVTATALELLIEMRLEEGKALYEDVSANCAVIAEKTALIEKRIEFVVQEYHEKLGKRVQQLLDAAELKIDEDLLAREVAIFAERCDISEEISRMKSHLGQFDQTCNSNGQAGRKLDFITQEMLREANTIGSKASDAEIASYVVDIKCAIDRIKEQVQNIE